MRVVVQPHEVVDHVSPDITVLLGPRIRRLYRLVHSLVGRGVLLVRCVSPGRMLPWLVVSNAEAAQQATPVKVTVPTSHVSARLVLTAPSLIVLPVGYVQVGLSVHIEVRLILLSVYRVRAGGFAVCRA